MTASWQIPAHLRPGEQPPAELSEGAKLISARHTLEHIRWCLGSPKDDSGNRWTKARRDEYLQSAIDGCLRLIR
jgi:hypothetical protein